MRAAFQYNLKRCSEYWRNIEKEIGDRIAKGVKGA